MTFKIPTGWIIALVLAVLLLVQWQCHRMKKVQVAKSVTIHDTIKGDPIPYGVSLPQPYPVWHDTGRPHWLYYPVDTGAILAEHFITNAYKDTLKDDTSALVVVIDTVKWNTLQNRGLIFQNRRVTINNLPAIAAAPNRLKIYAGATVGRKPDQFGFGPSIMLITPQDYSYSLAYDAINRDVYVTVLWKIGFRRKVP